MSGFVIPATPSIAPVPGTICAPALPQAANPIEAPIANDGWFPAIDPFALRATAQVRESVTPARWRAALIGAIMTAANDLDAWSLDQRAAGVASLAAVSPRTVDGRSRLVQLYERAVSLYAKAEILERQPDVDTTTGGQRRADSQEPTIGDLRRDALHAVRDILGRGRLDVELI